MNLLEAVVTKIIDNPKYYRHNNVEWWIVEVEYNCWGTKSTRALYFKDRDEAEKIEVGHKFLT